MNCICLSNTNILLLWHRTDLPSEVSVIYGIFQFLNECNKVVRRLSLCILFFYILHEIINFISTFRICSVFLNVQLDLFAVPHAINVIELKDIVRYR